MNTDAARSAASPCSQGKASCALTSEYSASTGACTFPNSGDTVLAWMPAVAFEVSRMRRSPARSSVVIASTSPNGAAIAVFSQVRPGAGSVTVNGRNVTILNGGRPDRPSWRVREHYQPASDNAGWLYRLDESNDGGASWNEGRTEVILRRAK